MEIQKYKDTNEQKYKNKFKQRGIKKFVFVFLCFSVFFVAVSPVFAQRQLGLEYATALELGTRDLRAIVMDIINIVLGFLGFIALIIVLYGGFVYMTSAGDSTKVEKAKKILTNGAIGLFIILASWGIVAFIFSLFGIGGPADRDPGRRYAAGLGALGSGIIQSHYPSRNQRDVPRNTMIAVTFKESIQVTAIIVFLGTSR